MVLNYLLSLRYQIKTNTMESKREKIEKWWNRLPDETCKVLLSQYDAHELSYDVIAKIYKSEVSDRETMEFKILKDHSIERLNQQIQVYIDLGWKPVGSHQAVVTHVQNRFSGLQHKDSVSTVEYSQSVIKEETDPKPILLEEVKDKKSYDSPVTG